jgi:hypothetical protein
MAKSLSYGSGNVAAEGEEFVPQCSVALCGLMPSQARAGLLM